MSPTPVTVERAAGEDVEAVADLWVRLAREQRVHDSYVLADENRETMRATLAGHLADDGVLVARLDGDIVGFASFSVERGALALEASRGLLSNLYVVPERRGQGIGSQLLRAVEDELAARDVDVLLLEVLAANEAARRFYRRAGYDPQRVGMARSLTGHERGDARSVEGDRSVDGDTPSGRAPGDTGPEYDRTDTGSERDRTGTDPERDRTGTGPDRD